MDNGSGNLNLVLSYLGGLGTIVTSFLGWLPPTAATVALIWYFIQIYESHTMQRWLLNRRTRKLARLKARVILMEAQGKPALPGPGD